MSYGPLLQPGAEPAQTSRKTLLGVIDAPEINVAIFAFLLNFPWELWQVPFWRDMPNVAHWSGIKSCTFATVGDVVIALTAFWIIAAALRSRRWIVVPTARAAAGFTAIGIAITIILEWILTGPLQRWTYSADMPTVPVLGTGLLPLLQWIILPPLIVWFVSRQLRGASPAAR